MQKNLLKNSNRGIEDNGDNMKIYQILAICGMLSPIFYTAMWIIGGKLQSDYSHIRHDISSLFAVGAPNQRLMQFFIIVSSILLFVFYLGLNDGLGDGGSIIGPYLFILSSILGILIAFFFPLDEGGEMTTWRGKMHLILVILMGILTIGGMILLWLRLKDVSGWSTFATYSLVSAIVALILLIIAGILIKSNYRGLLERLGVSPFQLFYFVLPLMIYLNN
jgi:drug/metabolite transporter (DMT)-like permease